MYLIAEIIDNALILENDEFLYKGIFDGWGLGIKKVITKNNIPFANLLIQKSFISNPGFEVLLETGESYNLQYIGFFKPRQSFKFEEDLYHIYPHRGSKNSIFKNGNQIGYWETSILNSYYKSSIKIYIDHNVNIDVVFILICALDFDLEEEESTATINLGSLFQARKFDSSWQPKRL